MNPSKLAEFSTEEEFCIIEALGTSAYNKPSEMKAHFPVLRGKTEAEIESWIATEVNEKKLNLDDDNLSLINNLRINQQAGQVEYQYGQEERLRKPDWQKIRDQLKEMPSLTQQVYLMDGTPMQEQFDMNESCLHYQFTKKQVIEDVVLNVLKRCINEDQSLYETIQTKFKEKIKRKAYDKAVEDFSNRINIIATTNFSDSAIPINEANLISQQLATVLNGLIQSSLSNYRYHSLIFYELSKIVFPDSSLPYIQKLHEDFIMNYTNTAETILKNLKRAFEHSNHLPHFWNIYQKEFIPILSKVIPPDKLQKIQTVIMNNNPMIPSAIVPPALS